MSEKKVSDPIVSDPIESEQPLTPDFDALSVSEHNITQTAEGQDAETKRGRPRMTDEQREAAREKKRAADRERKKPAKKSAGEKQADQTDEKIGTAKANAMMIVAGLEMICKTISDGQHITSKEQLQASHAVWADFLYEQDVIMPPWVQVTVISVAHILPAFHTHAGKSKAESMWIKVKAWWQLRESK